MLPYPQVLQPLVTDLLADRQAKTVHLEAPLFISTSIKQLHELSIEVASCSGAKE
jgi:hypothetical protein